jgi:hypothetical protein
MIACADAMHIVTSQRCEAGGTAMKLQKKWGLLLLGIVAILTGLSSFLPFLAGLGVVWAILWIVAGILLVLDM